MCQFIPFKFEKCIDLLMNHCKTQASSFICTCSDVSSVHDLDRCESVMLPAIVDITSILLSQEEQVSLTLTIPPSMLLADFLLTSFVMGFGFGRQTNALAIYM